MQLVSVERDVLVTPVTGLQVDQPQAEAVQLEQVVEAAAHEKRGSAAGNADGRGFNPALGIFESSRWHANRQRVGTPALQILLHRGVDRREDLRHRRSRPVQQSPYLQVKAAPAFFEQKSQVGWSQLPAIHAVLPRCVSSAWPWPQLPRPDLCAINHAARIDLRAIGRRIREIRGFDLTQAEFSKQLGIGQQQLSNYEKGRSAPTLEILVKLQALSDKSLDWIVRGQ